MTNCVARSLPVRLTGHGRRLTSVLPFACSVLLLASLGSAAPANPDPDVRRDAAVMAVERVLPSIVNISTETIVEVRDPLEELFRDFFGRYNGRRPPNAQKSLGSGVIVDEAGYILTNFHVVRRATLITVTLADGREFEARAVSRTAKSDLALLKIVAPGDEKFRAIRFALDDDLLLGETVLALGNPFGLGVSVSRGILSSKTRRPPVENEPLEMEDWLQTDAAINPGNSGGPLVNLRGELIGLNVAIFREGQGIGFAIPVKRLSEAVSEIFTPEAIRSLWFGGRFKLTRNGLVTAGVERGSPAEKGGLRAGDVIRKVNDTSPRSLMELHRALVSPDETQELQFEVQRKSEVRTLSVRLVPEKEVFNASLIRQKLGITVQDLTQQAAAQLGLNPGDGLLIAGVEKNSPASQANLARGYVLRAVDGQPADAVKTVAKLLHGRPAGQSVELSLVVAQVRGGYVQVYPAKVEVSLR